MLSEVTRIFIRFIFLVLLQVVILNNIEMGNLFNPFLYVMFILMLPFETPKWLLLLIGFITGLSIDIFTDTPGIHSTATLVMAFLRPNVLERIAPRDGYEFGVKPTLQHLGFQWYLSYAGILILAHHLVLFNLEVYRIAEFFYTFLRVFLSGGLTLMLVMLSQYLLYRPKPR